MKGINMNELKHTPGPWNLHPDYDASPLVVETETGTWVSWSWYIAKGKKIIGDIQAYSDGGKGFPRVDNRQEMIANAMLCAAAPELLEALEAFCSALSGDPTDINMAKTEGLYDKATAVIRKAKGEA